MCPIRSTTVCSLVNPKTSSTSFSLIFSPQNATSWSSIDSASRRPPSAPRAIACAAAGSSVIFSFPAMNWRCCAMRFAGMRWRSEERRVGKEYRFKGLTCNVNEEVELVHQKTQNQRYGSSHIGATEKDISNVVTYSASGGADIFHGI